MSEQTAYFQAIDAIISCGIPQAWKLPLLAWLRYADNVTLIAYPTAQSVADRAGVSIATARRAIQGAVSAGILEPMTTSKYGVVTRRLCVEALRGYSPESTPLLTGDHPTTHQRVPPYSPESTPLLTGDHPPTHQRVPELPIDLPTDLPNQLSPPRQRSRAAIEEVWEAYVKHHPRLAKRQPTDGEKKLIRSALKSASVDGMTQAEVLSMVIEWAHKAQDAAFYRGENEQRKAYLGLSVLLRITKLADKIDAAIAWRDGQAPAGRRRKLTMETYR